jgi:hypothetical protein
MPLTEKIPKLNTEEFYNKVKDFHLQISGQIDGPLKRVETESMDEWLMKLADAMSRYIQDYIEKVEIVGDTTAPDTQLNPGVPDTYGAFTMAPGPVVTDSDRGKFEGTLLHLVFLPGITSKYGIIKQNFGEIKNQGEYFIETNLPPPVEQPEPITLDNPEFDKLTWDGYYDDMNTKEKEYDSAVKKWEDGKTDIVDNQAKLKEAMDASLVEWNSAIKKFNDYDAENPEILNIEVDAPSEPDRTMGNITGIYLQVNDNSGTELELERIPLATKVEIKKDSSTGMYIIEEKIPMGDYIYFKLIPGVVEGSLIEAGAIELNWEADAGSLARIQLKEELFEVYKLKPDDSLSHEENIRKVAELTATAIDNFVESGDVIMLTDTPDIRIDKNIPSVGPIVTTGKTTSEGIPMSMTTMGIGKGKVVERETPKETLINNLTLYGRHFGPEVGVTGTIDQICSYESYGFVDSIHSYIVTCLVQGEHIIPLLVFMPGTTTSDTVLTPSATGVTPVPGYVGATLIPWPIVPLSSIGDVGHGVFDGADGGYSVDEDWIAELPTLDTLWNETIWKEVESVTTLEYEVENITAASGVRG